MLSAKRKIINKVSTCKLSFPSIFDVKNFLISRSPPCYQICHLPSSDLQKLRTNLEPYSQGCYSHI